MTIELIGREEAINCFREVQKQITYTEAEGRILRVNNIDEARPAQLDVAAMSLLGVNIITAVSPTSFSIRRDDAGKLANILADAGLDFLGSQRAKTPTVQV